MKKILTVSLGEFKTNVNTFDFGFNFNAAIGLRNYSIIFRGVTP